MNDFLHRLAWRLGRKLYCWGRGDSVNDPLQNGEYWLLEQVLGSARGVPLLLDVGSNKGDWSFQAISISERLQKSPVIHAFEPCAKTRTMLESRLAARVQVWSCALSSAEGEADFFSNGAGSGTNSLGQESGTEVERVQITTLDAFMASQGLDKLTMLKIDTEGFDCEVLRGAAKALANKRIDVIQFEYNWRWLANRSSLRDVFQLIEGTQYRLGKLVGNAVVFYEKWHFELDRYFENNYVLVPRGSVIERLGKHVHFDASNVAAFD